VLALSGVGGVGGAGGVGVAISETSAMVTVVWVEPLVIDKYCPILVFRCSE